MQAELDIIIFYERLLNFPPFLKHVYLVANFWLVFWSWHNFALELFQAIF